MGRCTYGDQKKNKMKYKHFQEHPGHKLALSVVQVLDGH